MRKKEFNFHIQSWVDARLDNLKHHAKSSLLKYRILTFLIVIINIAAIVCVFTGMAILFNRDHQVKNAIVYKSMVILAGVMISLIALLQGVNIIYKQRMSNLIYDEARQAVLIEFTKYKQKLGKYSDLEKCDALFNETLDTIVNDTKFKVENRRKSAAVILKYNTRIDSSKLKEAMNANN